MFPGKGVQNFHTHCPLRMTRQNNELTAETSHAERHVRVHTVEPNIDGYRVLRVRRPTGWPQFLHLATAK